MIDFNVHYPLLQSPSKLKGTSKTSAKRKRPQKSPTAKGHKQPSQPRKKRVKKDASQPKAPPREFPDNRCDRCGQKFSCAAKIKEHIRVVHDRLMLSCQICNATMKWSSNMTVHMYTKHQIGDAPKKKEIKRDCVRCNIKFRSNQLLYEHLKSVHKEENVFKCPKCFETFSNYNTFFYHKTDHPELLPQELPHQCSVCHLRFTKVKLLVRHSERFGHKTDYEQSTYQDLNCFKCGKGFSSYTSLSTHVKMTNIYKQCTYPHLVCAPCKKVFDSRKDLEKHMKAVHPNRVIRKRRFKYAKRQKRRGKDLNKCEICGKVLANSTTMTYHLNMHKGVKNFKCDLCEYRASFPSSVRSHRKTHFGDMKYFCRTCGKGYKKRALWRACEFMHTGKAPHQCSLCKKQFVSDFAFQCHKKWHEKGKYKKKPQVTDKVTEHSSEETSEIVCQSGAQGGAVVDDNSSKTNATERVQIDEITNIAVRNLLMRGQKFAESVDDTVIADFKKPKPKLLLPAKPVSNKKGDKAAAETSHKSAKTDGKSAERIVELVNEDTSGDKDACDTEIASGPSTSTVAEDINETENMGHKLAESNDKRAEADDKHSEADDKLAKTADKSVKNIGELVDKDDSGDKAVCTEVTRGLTRQGDAGVKKDVSTKEIFEWREVKSDTTILWREVTVEEVVKSINNNNRLAYRRDNFSLDIFNDIVFR